MILKSIFRALLSIGLIMNTTCLPMTFAGQQSNPNVPGGSTQRTLSSNRIADLLRQPNGLESCADLVGNFEITRNIRPWSDVNLPTQVAGSDLIIIGKIKSQTSNLIDEGDDIETTYVIHPTGALKGAIDGDVSLTVQGGTVTFTSGNSATINSVEYQQLQPGQRYLVFLQKEKDKHYSLTNGLESLFKLSTRDGNIDAFANHDGRQHAVVADVKGLSEAALLSKISALSAANPNPSH